MATLINMENTPEEAKEMVSSSPGDAPKYPWGLALSLNDESLTKLGIDNLPGVGTEVMIVAKASVTSVSQRQTENEGSKSCLDLQITEMQVSGTQKDVLGRATDALYGGTNAS